MVTTKFDSTMIGDVAGIVRRAAKIPQSIQIRGDSQLLDDLGIDSLDLVAVILQLQDHFEVVIEADAVPHLRRVVDLANYLGERMEALRS